MPPPPSKLLGLCMLLMMSLVGCPCIDASVNSSPQLRWWIFSNFGAREICKEMTQRGVALHQRPNEPAVGRFWADSCATHLDSQRQTVMVRFGGTGYAYTPVSRRIGFRVDQTAVEYRMDFRSVGNAQYIWGVFHREAQPPSFRITSFENPIIGAAAVPLSAVGNMVGSQLVEGNLRRGFTVYHRDNASIFTSGIVRPPHRPVTPFRISEKAFYTYANDRVALYPGQLDFLGAFAVTDDDQYLRVHLQVSGPPVEVLVVHERVGLPWRRQYEAGITRAPRGPILAGGATRRGLPFFGAYPLPKGRYYVVLDHASQVGRIGPPLSAAFGNVATVGVEVQLRER